MAKKYYAVKNGKSGDGIYDSWDACKMQVQGAKGVTYKGFPTREEAEAYLLGYTQAAPKGRMGT